MLRKAKDSRPFFLKKFKEALKNEVLKCGRLAKRRKMLFFSESLG
jgi:hypothetical protein